jgi:plasmid stabilization system protein ParE
MLEFSIHRLARREYETALARYRSYSQRTGERFAAEVLHTIESICEFPESHPFQTGTYRFALVRRYPYRLIYYVKGDTVRVVAVAHGRRRPNYWRRRN